MAEPLTAITDWLLAAVTFVLGGRLVRAGRRERIAVQLHWGAATLVLGVAAAVGGTYHAFHDRMSAGSAATLWQITTLAAGAAVALLLVGGIRSTIDRARQRLLIAAVICEFLVYAAWMLTHDDFLWVIAHSAAGFACLLLLEIRAALAGRAGAAWALLAIVTFFAAAAVQQSDAHLGRLNHNDVYHLVQLLGVALLYRGARDARDA
jgi:hypothetical protein